MKIMKELSKKRSPAAENISSDKIALNRNVFYEALKCSQQILNQLEVRDNVIRKTHLELEIFKEDFKEVKDLNEELVEKMRTVESEVEFKEEKNQKLYQELNALIQESEKLQEVNEVEKQKLKEAEYEAKYLKINLDEEKKTRDFIAKELRDGLKEKEKKEQQLMKMEILVSNSNNTINDLQSKIECLEKEAQMKQQMIKNFEERMKHQHGLSDDKQNQSIRQQCLLVIQENEELKKKVVNYKKNIGVLEQRLNENEVEYRRHVKILEKKIKVITNNQGVSVNNQQKLNSSILTSSQTDREIKNTLQDLSDSEKSRKGMLLEMQSKSMDRKEQKYDGSQQGRKLNRISIEKNERKALLTRLNKLEAENQILASDSKQVFFDMKFCQEQNTQLVSKMKHREEQMNALYEVEIVREENTKLAKRLRIYEEKLNDAQKKTTFLEECKKRCKEMELENRNIKIQLETVENEKKAMEQKLLSLQNDLEFYQRSSDMRNKKSCCFDLKHGKQQLENEVTRLQSRIKTLEEKNKLLVNSEEGSKDAKEKLETTKNALEQAIADLDDCKLNLKECKRENAILKSKQIEGDFKTTIGQPHVNVHVHLDPNQLLGHSPKCEQTPKQQQNKEQEVTVNSSTDSEERIRDLLEEIQMLTKEKNEIEEKLKTFPDDASAIKIEDNKDQNKVFQEEIADLKKEKTSLMQKNKKITLLKTKLETNLDVLQNQLEEQGEANNRLQNEIDELKKSLEKAEEGNKKQEKNFEDEILELNKKLREQSNEDMECLRKKIQDLTTKKQKNETLIEKLKDEKADFQTKVKQIEREVEDLKQQLEDYENNNRRSQQQIARHSTEVDSPRDVLQHDTEDHKNNNNIKVDSDESEDETTSQMESMKQPSKPSWLTPPSKIKPTEDEKSESDEDFLDIPFEKTKASKPSQQQNMSTEKKNEVKKPSIPLWLTSTPKKNETAEVVVEEEEDFLNIRPKRKQFQNNDKKHTKNNEELDGLSSRLDTSNRRNVKVRSVNKSQTKQSDDVNELFRNENNPLDTSNRRNVVVRNVNKSQTKQSDDEDELFRNENNRLDTSNRRNVVKRDVNKSQTKKSNDEFNFLKTDKSIDTKSKTKEPVDAAEKFLQNLKLKSKKQENTLDFLTLDDIIKPAPSVKSQPISALQKRAKPIRNAEFLIP